MTLRNLSINLICKKGLVVKMDLLRKAVDYAKKTGSFHKMNLVDSAEHVCVYGLGKYFDDAFIRQNVKKRFHVDMLCDMDNQKAKEVCSRKEFLDLTPISLNSLDKMRNVFVIVMLGNPSIAINEIGKRIGYQNVAAYNDVALDEVISADEKYRDITVFKESEDDIFKTYDLLCDDKSRSIYANIICNRIAPQYAQMSYSDMCQYPQYFPNDVFKISDNEKVADIGAYTGDTLQEFIKISGGKFSRYYAFEMDKENYDKMEAMRLTLDENIGNKIICYNVGVTDLNGIIEYGKNSSSDSYSIYNKSEICQSRTVRLDDFIKDDLSYIKMDIEGAEIQALKGAANIIKYNKPRMGICVYHRLEDIYKIPQMLKSFNPDYRISIRHHAQWWVSETVCYAY